MKLSFLGQQNRILMRHLSADLSETGLGGEE